MLISCFGSDNSGLFRTMILDGGLIILSIVLGFSGHGNMAFYLLLKRFLSIERLSSL